MQSKPLSIALILTLILSLTSIRKLYAQEPAQAVKKPKVSPQALWVMNEGDISVFQPARLKVNGRVGPYLIKNSYELGAITFDHSNDLWIGLCDIRYDTGALIELTSAGLRHLVAFGKAKPSVVIQDVLSTNASNEYLGCPRGFQFDGSGNLWVQSTDTPHHGQALLEYAKNDLQVSGSPLPAATIETPTISYGFGPISMALNHAGDLWLVDSGFIEYTATQLASGVQTDPNQTMNSEAFTGSSFFPTAIAFDSNDNLWAISSEGGSFNSGELEMFAAQDLNFPGTATVAPAITIDAVSFGKPLVRSFADPLSLAFDNTGDLWIGNRSQAPNAGPGLVEFTPSQLSASGSPVPAHSIIVKVNPRGSDTGTPYYMMFGPPLP
jgi:hypothetical protein